MRRQLFSDQVVCEPISCARICCFGSKIFADHVDLTSDMSVTLRRVAPKDVAVSRVDPVDNETLQKVQAIVDDIKNNGEKGNEQITARTSN